MQIPAILVEPFRVALRTQGADPYGVVDNYGNINMGALISAFYNRVTIRTAVTPDMEFTIDGEPSPAWQQELLNRLRPTVVLSGRAGTYVLAPYGEEAASEGPSMALPIVGLLAAAGIAYWALK
jgi:hypothetical protein